MAIALKLSDDLVEMAKPHAAAEFLGRAGPQLEPHALQPIEAEQLEIGADADVTGVNSLRPRC